MVCVLDGFHFDISEEEVVVVVAPVVVALVVVVAPLAEVSRSSRIYKREELDRGRPDTEFY